ncbi:MAG TPA: hypothetical protein VD884_03515 [Ohtaekwangia sp.]|nr:hypothetical protein [Ohtaekwangia sp.]
MPKNDFSKLEKEALIELLLASQGTLEKTKSQLRNVREKLKSARKRIRKMNDIILYQRKRILESIH